MIIMTKKRTKKRNNEGECCGGKGEIETTGASYVARRAAQKERVGILHSKAVIDILNLAVHRHLFFKDADALRQRFKTNNHVEDLDTIDRLIANAEATYNDADEEERADSDGKKQKMKKRKKMDSSILLKGYTAGKDDCIRELDVPERMQVALQEGTGSRPLDTVSIDEEATWIYNQITSGTVPLIGKTVVGNSISRDDILRFLNLHLLQKLDVPCIAMYRKEEVLSLLKDPEHVELNDGNVNKSVLKWHKGLWAVLDLDRKWVRLHLRKSGIQSRYNQLLEEKSPCIFNETRLALNMQLFESVMKSLKAAESEREVDDVVSMFDMHFLGVDWTQCERSEGKSSCGNFSKVGLCEVARKFGHSSEFGLQLSLEKMNKDELEDTMETPDEMASKFTCVLFETPQAVLEGARLMAAADISSEPCVRKYVRSKYLDIFELSTSPTAAGNVAIDDSHQFAGVKWLQRKALNNFADAQWLLIQKAEKENLLRVTIELPSDRLNKLISDFSKHYLSDCVSKSVQLWNEQRKLILQDALFNFLLPSMEKEARSLLTSRAKKWLIMEYGNAFSNKVSVGPPHLWKENDKSSDGEAAPRVLACCWGPGTPATTFVMLNSSGKVLDVLYTELRSQKIDHLLSKKKDEEHVLKFMTNHKPHVVVIGAVNSSCALLRDDIYEIFFKMAEESPRDNMYILPIVYGDESLAHLYATCQISSYQLHSKLGSANRAVALGRYLQNPLAMVAALCGAGREILSWKLCAFDNFLTSDEKYVMIEQVMIDVTNQVGLDINLAIQHQWLFAPLQFISGLGPRKAESLQQSLVRSGAIFSREDLKKQHGLGEKVFANAVGFLCVRQRASAASSQSIDLLGDTRIHPDSYILAKQLATDVYDVNGGNDNEDAMKMAVQHIRDQPGCLKNLDIEAYARSKKSEKKMQTLYDTKSELLQGFRDWRKQYKLPSKEEEFDVISGDFEQKLRILPKEEFSTP